jgi:hypothetical protein
MSGWDQHSGQGFYNPEASGYYGNYGAGNDPGSYASGGITFMSPAPIADGYDASYVDAEDEFANEPPLLGPILQNSISAENFTNHFASSKLG